MGAMYLNFLILSDLFTNGNVRGEGSTGGAEIQVVDGLSVLTGVAISHSWRVAIAELIGWPRMFRKHGVTDSASGYGYGPKNEPLSAVAAQMEDTGNFLKFIDVYFGAMLAGKGEKAFSRRSSIYKGLSFSTTPFGGDRLMQQGHKGNGDLVPFHVPMHLTRYVTPYTINLADFLDHPEYIYILIMSAVRGFPVGGNQTNLRNLLKPAVCLWRTHKDHGSGLTALGYMTPKVNESPNIDFFIRQAIRHNTPFQAHGDFTHTVDLPESMADLNSGTTIPFNQTVEAIFADSMAMMGLDAAKVRSDARKMLREGV